MNDTIIAAKAKEQHENFLGKVFTHFSKPKARFIREATYGIQASGDTKLSSIVRAIEYDVTPPPLRRVYDTSVPSAPTLASSHPVAASSVSNLQRLSYQSGARLIGEPKETAFPVISSSRTNRPHNPPFSREKRQADAEKTSIVCL